MSAILIGAVLGLILKYLLAMPTWACVAISIVVGIAYGFTIESLCRKDYGDDEA